MSTLRAFGIAVTPPSGWDGELYLRGEPALLAAASADPAGVAPPAGTPVTAILHTASFPLPVGRGDYGGGAVELMNPTDVFVSLLEHDPAEANAPLFAAPPPWPLGVDDFSPRSLQRRIGGHGGCQRFFRVGRRAFCLYVVLGSYANRAALLPSVNAMLASLQLTA